MDFADIVALLLLTLTTTGALATTYLWRVWRSDIGRPRSRVLGLLAYGALIAELVAAVLAPVAAARLLDIDLPVGIGVFAGSTAVIVGLLIPHMYALFVFLWRRGTLR